MGSPDGEIISVENWAGWEIYEADPNNPCIVHIKSAMICYSDPSQIPETWQELCQYEGPMAM